MPAQSGDTPKERSNMIKARIAARLTQKEVAKILKVNIASIVNWEKAHTTPQLYQIADLRVAIKFNGTDEELLQVFVVGEAVEEPKPQSCQTMTTSDKLDSSDSHMSVQGVDEELSDMDKGRRKLNTTIAIAATTIPTLPLLHTTQFVVNPLVDAYLDTCETSLNTWWDWYNTRNDLELEKALSKHVPMLKGIATTPFQTTISPYQRQAAAIAVQAMIMQIGIATHNLEFLQREKYCYDAVQLAEISGDKNLLALALFWYGDTFTYCYEDPQTVLQHLNDAKKNVSSIDGNPLTAIQIYSDLSIAHAQNHDESSALDCIKLAYITMPSNPELDNRLYAIGHAELDQKVGKTYLYLAEHLNNHSYALQARDLFEKSASQAISNGYGYLIQALIRQADAYRVLGEKDMCVKGLTSAYEKVPSVLRLSQIDGVLSRVPPKWKRETAVKKLQKDVSHALVVARR